MNSDETARLLRLAHRQDILDARDYFAGSGHLGTLEARELAYDPSSQAVGQAEHLRTCGRCSRLLSHLRDAIVHPGDRDLAAWAEGSLTGHRARDLQVHLEIDRCRPCRLRLRRSPKVAAYRALISAALAIGSPRAAPHPLSAFAPVAVGLRSSDHSSTVEILVTDRESGVSARLWQVEKGALEVVVSASDSSMANARVSVEVVGPEDSWENEVMLTEHYDYGWVGRCTVGAVQDVLPRLLGEDGKGLALTVGLPDEISPKRPSFRAPGRGEPGRYEEGEITGRLSDSDPMVRYTALSSISSQDAAVAPGLSACLIAMLRDSGEDPGIRAAAAEALGSLGPSAASSASVEALRQLLEDSDLRVRESAAAALRAMAE